MEWNQKQQSAFPNLKKLLSSDTVLDRFDPVLSLGIAYDASNIGIGVTLFHCYPVKDEKPFANVPKHFFSSPALSIARYKTKRSSDCYLCPEEFFSVFLWENNYSGD